MIIEGKGVIAKTKYANHISNDHPISFIAAFKILLDLESAMLKAQALGVGPGSITIDVYPDSIPARLSPTEDNSEIMKNVKKAAEEILEEENKESKVNHPSHYNTGKIEVIDFIEDQKLGFNDGNAVKYTSRAKHKGNRRQDIEKAIWYLNRELEGMNNE